jgi:hypothetical protein
MSAKRHRHTFTALWWHFGEYGRQDVHAHSCITDDEPDCDRVLISDGRDCTPKQGNHRETLVSGDTTRDERAVELKFTQMKAATVKCCNAGREAYPDPCPWHPKDGQR